MMENDLSARAFDTIARKSGQFGFFQKRIFFINALIQSVCLSILLYTNVCVPELDLTNMADGPLPLPAKNGTGQLFNNNTNGTFTNHSSTIDNSTTITTTNNNHTTNNNTTTNFQLPTAFNLSTLPNQHSHNAPSSTQPLTYSSLLQETTEPDPNANNNNIINNNDDNTRDDNNGVFVDLSAYMPTTITNHVDTPNKNKNSNNNYNNADNSNKNNDNNNDNNNDDILHRHKRRDTIHTDHLSSNVVDQDQLTTESLQRLDQDIGGQFREQNGAVGIPSITAQREHGVDDSRASPQEVRKDAKLQTISNRSNYNDLVDKHDNNSNNDDDDDDVDGVDFNDDNVSDKLLNANDYDSLHGNVDTPPVSSVKNKNNNDYNYSNINDGDDDDNNNNNNNKNHIKNENSDNDDYKNKYHNINNNNNNNDINDSTYYKNRKDINNKNEDNDDNEVSTLSVQTKSHEHNKPDDVKVMVYAHHSPHRNIPPANTKDTTTTTTTTTHFGRPHFRRPHPDPNHVTLSQEETPQTLPPDRNGNGNGDDDETPKSRKGRGNPVARLKENMASVTVETTSTEQQPSQYGDFPTKRTNGVNTTSTERQPSRYGDFPSNRTSVVNENTTIEEDSDGPVHPLMDLRITRDQLLSSFDLEDLLQLAFTLQGVGVVLGSLMGGLMADVFGRRRPLFLSLLGMAVTQCALALSVSWTLFLVLRTFAVGFAGATLVVSFVMVIEFVGPSWRDACTCSCLWTLGAVSLSLETMVTTNWRWLALFSGGLALPLLGTFYTTPESLRWLQCHHKFPAAEGVYREVVSVNSAAVPEIMSLLDQARVCIVNNMHRKRYTFLDLFYNLTSVRSTFALVYTGMVSSCVYACLSSIVRQLTGNPYVDGFLPFLIDMPLTWSTIIVNRCLGRRWCLFLYSVASGLALMSVTILHMTGNVSSMPSLITGIALFGKIGVTASILLIFLVAIEMYPTVSRGMGVGVALASGSGGIILSQVLLFLRDYHYIVPFVVYGLMMSTVGLVGLLLPETLNLPLTNVQQCRHRKIPLVEGGRQAGGPPFP